MTTTKIFGALGPVALATAVCMGASGAAHALMIDGGITGVTYAKETLRLDLTSSAVGDATKYYDIIREHVMVAPAQVRKTERHDAERYTVLYELSGMVFAERIVDSDFMRTADADGTTEDGNATFEVYAGGAKGDKYVVFQVNADIGTVETTDVLTLSARFAVSVGGGDIKRTVTNANLTNAGLPESVWKRIHEISNAVTVKSALKETVMPMDAVAQATHDFMAFGGNSVNPDLTTSLGSVLIGVEENPYLRNAQAADDDVAATQDAVEEMVGIDGIWEEVRNLSDIIALKTTAVANPVNFAGDVSFVSKVALLSSESCGGLAGATDLRVPSKDDPKVLTDTLMETDANDFTSAMHLCLMVDGETAIPEGLYSVGRSTRRRVPPTHSRLREARLRLVRSRVTERRCTSRSSPPSWNTTSVSCCATGAVVKSLSP